MAVDAGTIFSEVRIALDKLTGDVNSVNTKLDTIAKKSDEVGKKSQGPFSKFFSFIKKSGVASFLALGLAIAKVSKFLKESEAAARDAQEVYSKFDTVFESIQASANKTADSFAESFGIAGSTARELLGTTGDLLVGMGATEEQALTLSSEVNTLAADLASFSNIQGGTARASAALTKALLGERESAKLLGIVLRETDIQQRLAEKGQKALTGQALLLAKAQVTLELATEQSQKALGDYARTADSAANVEKRLLESNKSLKEQVGTSFSQVVTAVRIKIIKWADALAEVLKTQNELVELTKKEDEGNATTAESIRLLGIQIEAEQKRIRIAEESGQVSQFNLEKSRAIAEINIQNAADQIELLRKLNKVELVRAKAQAEQNTKDEAAAKLEEDRLKAQIADTQFRIKVEKDLQNELFAIEQQAQLAIETGEEFNEELEKQKAVQSALNKLFAEQFTLTGPGVQRLIDGYGEFLTITKDIVSVEETRRGTAEQWHERELARIFEVAEAEKKATEEFEELMQRRIDTSLQFGQSTLDLFTAIDSLQDASAAAELQRLEDAGASEEELEAKRKQIAHDNAVREKKLNSLSVALNTASAIVGFLARPGGLAGLALSGIAAATGAVQLAAVNAAPIPNFQTGGIVLPSSGGSLVNVAENGSPELLLNAGESGQDLLGQFADQISSKMGGSLNLIIQAGSEIILQQKIDSWFKNNEVLVDVSTQLTGVK